MKISNTHHKTKNCVVKRNPRRIKNWKKLKTSKDAWENTKTFSGVSIEKLGDVYYVEERYITKLFNKEHRKHLKGGFKTKEDAKKYAMKYMKANSDFR